mgnify:CR=1 FL=1
MFTRMVFNKVIGKSRCYDGVYHSRKINIIGEHAMNNVRRKQLKNLANRISIMNDIQDTSHLQEYYSILEDIKNDEEEYYDNMPENLQGSMRGMDSEEAISNMDDALEVLEQAIDEKDQDILLDLLAEAADLIETAAV